MTGIMGGIGIGLLTNAVYDTVKYVGNRLGNSRKIKDRDLIEMVEHRVLSNAPDDVKPLLESSVFVGYFCSAQCIDIINAYIEYKIIYNCSNANVKVKQHIKKAGIIRIQDVIEYISNNIYQQYIEHEVLDIPDSAVIKKAVLYVISISEIIATETLTPESARLLYLINSRLDDFYENIIDLLIKLHANIEGIQAKQITGRNDEYEKIKDKYCKVLKDKNSDAHIYLLDKFPFERFYVPPILQRISRNQALISIYDVYGYYGHELIAWKDIFEKENIVYLTGGAGYGKSLFTKKIINNYTELNIFHANEYVVIYGELKNFYPNGSTSALSVIEFLKQSVRNSTLIDVPNEFIEHYLNAGRCIILLDALDEVDKQKRNMLHESVVAYFKNQNPNNKICITSRDRGFIPERNVEVFKIRPLNEEQIEKYVDKIIALDKFEKEEKNAFMTQSRVLVEKGFLNSFLVLSLLINIIKQSLNFQKTNWSYIKNALNILLTREKKIKRKRLLIGE